jgi:uncharacterized protein YkwD
MSLNDQLKTAKRLRPSNGGSNVYSGKVGGKESNQFYQLRINRASNVNLDLARVKANTNLSLLNDQGKVLSRSVQNQRSNAEVREVLQKGTYYIRVGRQRGNTRYQLRLSVANMPASSGLPSLANLSSITNRVLALTNFHRQQSGLAPLKNNAILTAVAQSHTENMVVRDFYSHQAPDGSRSADRIRRAGYNYSFAAENIAAGYDSADAVVQGWMNSPGHRANIMNPNLQEIGVGFYFIANDPGTVNYRYYWTQNFGTPGR